MRGVLSDGTQLTRTQTKNHKVEGAEININKSRGGSKFPSFSFQKIFRLSVVDPRIESIDEVGL